MEAQRRVPVTVLTGFLGSGKTTLLNYILTENHGKRIAVIENEFGEIGIDNDLVLRSDEEIFEMNNGCICCTVRGDLIRILNNLMKRKDRFDYILIETTGLADPAPVVQTFFVDDELREQMALDGLVTLVDSMHISQHLGKSPEADEQIAFADVVLLNKIDLVSPEALEAVEQRIRRMNSQARIFRTHKSRHPLEELLHIRAFDLKRALTIDPGFLGDEPHEHDTSVSSVGIEVQGDADPKKLNTWLGRLLREQGTDIYRMKGIISVKGRQEQLVFQGVHMLFDSEDGKAWGKGPRTSKMVFIGKNLDRAALNDGFRRCLA
jgi:G3E family GTPase